MKTNCILLTVLLVQMCMTRLSKDVDGVIPAHRMKKNLLKNKVMASHMIHKTHVV